MVTEYARTRIPEPHDPSDSDVCPFEKRTAAGETDHPHTGSTWPDSKKVAQDLMGDLPDDVVYKIPRGNAIRISSLDLV
jgi:hypothetical protein